MMSDAMLPPTAQANNPSGTGPRIRTFTFGNGTGRGGIMGGAATISIGGGPVLARDEDGFVRDPWSGGGRTAPGEGGREWFGGDGNQLSRGGGAGGEYHPGPGYVTIEDLLSHFLGGMTGLGSGGGGPIGDYVLSDGKVTPLPPFRKVTDFRVEGLDRVLEELMHAAGEHNRPPPASEVVINGLPRIKLDQATLGMPCVA